MPTQPNIHQVARAGRYFVAAELYRRGAYAKMANGSKQGVHIVAHNREKSRTISLFITTRRSGDWQSSTEYGRPMRRNPRETRFWVFVDLTGDIAATPRYYIVEDWRIRNDIYETHQKYLQRKGGKRPITPKSKHHKIGLERVKRWKRWDLLRLF